MARGINYTTQFRVANTPEQVIQYITTTLAGSPGSTVNMVGNNTLMVSRRFIPTWAILVGIVGIFFFLVGVLAFFVKETETLSIAAAPAPEGGSVVTISGIAGGDLAFRLNNAVNALMAVKTA